MEGKIHIYDEEVRNLMSNQEQINGRLNGVIIKMRDVIIRQNGLIENALQEMTRQNNNNEERVQILENYSEQINQ